MITHLAALFAAIVLTEWLIIAGWMSNNSIFYVWAGVVVLAWWLATRRNNPAWLPARSHLRWLILFLYFLITMVVAVLVENWRAYLIAGGILALMLIDSIRPEKRKNGTDEEDAQR